MRPIVESAEARLRVRAEFPHRGKAREAAAPRHGVVTDWIRRMLLSGTDGPSAAKVAYRHAELAGQMPTVYSDDSPQVQRNKLWHFDGAAGLDDARKRAFRSAQRMGSAWYRMNQLNWHGPPDGGLQVRPEDWNSVAATLDKEVIESRRADNRLGAHNKNKLAPKKTFSNLALVGSLTRTYPSSGHWMAAIEDVIPESAAAKFGFSRPGASGHAVAVGRKGKATDTNDAFWILDPNLGVFAANQDGMLYMLQVLFWYDADRTPFYKTCAESTGRTRVNYMIWQRAPGALV